MKNNEEETHIASAYDSDDGRSEISLRIIDDSPKAKRKQRPPLILDARDKQIVDEIENELEDKLDEKAAKANLTNVNVKSLIRHVFSDKDVVEFVKHKIEGTTPTGNLKYEPKLTRAKAKELFSSQPINNWLSPNSEPSETHKLINEELPDEDSSEDEYIPGEEESEDDNNQSFQSEPETPQSTECGTQTQWSDDGIFKLPPVADGNDEDKTIALRTRSKLCLSDTPLEVIEERLIPPDITTDMYDMECDDDVWSNFLKEFTRPLDEVTKVQEDEDHDPEYNILADEDMDMVDKEELRVDRGVKVTRKELNELISELVEYAENYNNSHYMQTPPISRPDESSDKEPSQQCSEQANFQREQIIVNAFNAVETEDDLSTTFRDDQKLLLHQQLRIHVQLLTQLAALTYRHIEFSSLSPELKRMLLAMQDQANLCPNTFSYVYNLTAACQFVNEWEAKIDTDDEEVCNYRERVSHLYNRLMRQKKSEGINRTVPQLFKLRAIFSPAFLYPTYLTTSALRPSRSTTKRFNNHINSFSEQCLLAHGFEIFVPYVMKRYGTVNNRATPYRLLDVCLCLTKFLNFNLDPVNLRRYVAKLYNARAPPNPVKSFFQYNVGPTITHKIIPITLANYVPLVARPLEEVPPCWRHFVKIKKSLYERIRKPKLQALNNVIVINTNNTTNIQNEISLPALAFSITISKPPTTKASSTKKRKKSPAPNNQLTFKRFCNDDAIIQKRFYLSKQILRQKLFLTRIEGAGYNMLPSMPNIFSPIKDTDEEEIELIESIEDNNVDDLCEIEAADQDNPNDKDNLEDINALLVASSTIKNNEKRKLTCSEKKKAKLKREFYANLRMVSEESDDAILQKTNRFITAFHDKLLDKLSLEDYQKFMSVLNDFDEKKGCVIDLHKSVYDIIGIKYPEIMDEFLTFFTSLQAKKVGKLVPYLVINNMSIFLRKLELFFQNQPSQAKKIYRCLTELSSKENVTANDMKSAILPLLKGNALLIDWFLQIFPSERPTERLLAGPWDLVEIGKDPIMSEDDHYETITIPEVEDPYGGSNCICNCHNSEDDGFKSKAQHCVSCGLKFIQGRIFIPSGKALRLATVSFDEDNADNRARISCPSKSRRPESSSPLKISPGKDSQDEGRLSSDEESDKKQNRIKRTPRRSPKKKIIDIANIDESAVDNNNFDMHSEVNIEDTIKKDDSFMVLNENTSDSSIIEGKNAAEDNENIEWDCNTSIESMELKLSPENDNNSADSELEAEEFCEETSQDNNSDSSDTEELEGMCEQSDDSNVQWTKDEDRIILETFQREEHKEEALEKIASQLKNRSTSSISERFDLLLGLIKAM